MTSSPADTSAPLRVHVIGESTLDNTIAYWQAILGEVEKAPAAQLLLIDELSLKYTGLKYAEFNPKAGQDAQRVVVRVTARKVVGRI